MSQGFNLTISIPSGNPDQLRLIQKTNRRVLGLVFNRNELARVSREREELGFSGVYLLVNSSSDTLPQIYIGEVLQTENQTANLLIFSRLYDQLSTTYT